MDLDPNVQVAIVSVFTAIITTAGVIIVAIINNRKERGKAASAGVEAGLDERDVLERLLSLISDNEEQEEIIQSLTIRNRVLEEENRALKLENSQLILKSREGGISS